MQYHTIKMEEINKVIRQYWLSVYKGTDIDTVEIRSEFFISIYLVDSQGGLRWYECQAGELSGRHGQEWEEDWYERKMLGRYVL